MRPLERPHIAYVSGTRLSFLYYRHGSEATKASLDTKTSLYFLGAPVSDPGIIEAQGTILPESAARPNHVLMASTLLPKAVRLAGPGPITLFLPTVSGITYTVFAHMWLAILESANFATGNLQGSPFKSASLPTFQQVCLETQACVFHPVLGIGLLQPKSITPPHTKERFVPGAF